MRGRIVLGILLATIGLSWALSYNGIDLFPGGWSTWWPLTLVLVGLVTLTIPPRRYVGGTILIALGALLQTWRLELVPGIPWAYAAPIALVLIGAMLVTSALTWRRRRAAYAHWCAEHTDWRQA